MKVMVTGATGFLGSHCVEALQRAGHATRLLVRSPEKVDRVLAARGIGAPELVVGDMTRASDVEEALEGCDAVVHAAATLYGGEDVLAANVAGVRHVVGGAVRRGLDPIVYVSSIAAMYPPPGDRITVHDPIASLRTTYGRSKAEGERLARELQDEGAPVVILYPAGVYGPHDPGPCETTKGLRDGIRWLWMLTSSGVGIVDVRDVARIIAAALEPGRGPRRYMAGGHYVSWPDQAELIGALTGRPLRSVPAPPWLLRGAGRLIDLMRRFVPLDYPLTSEAVAMMTGFVPCDSRATVEELGVAFRPTEETLADAIRWLVEAGHLPPRFAPRLL